MEAAVSFTAEDVCSAPPQVGPVAGHGFEEREISRIDAAVCSMALLSASVSALTVLTTRPSP